jgi:hypothetical protein
MKRKSNERFVNVLQLLKNGAMFEIHVHELCFACLGSILNNDPTVWLDLAVLPTPVSHLYLDG